jgi:hypothetical protein
MHPKSPPSYGKGLAGANYLFLPLLFNSTNHLLLPWRQSWNLDEPFPLGVDSYPYELEQVVTSSTTAAAASLTLLKSPSLPPLPPAAALFAKSNRIGKQPIEKQHLYISGSSNSYIGNEENEVLFEDFEETRKRSDSNLRWGAKELERIRGVLDDDWVGSSKLRLEAAMNKKKKQEQISLIEKQKEEAGNIKSSEEDGLLHVKTERPVVVKTQRISEDEDEVQVFVVSANYVTPT